MDAKSIARNGTRRVLFACLSIALASCVRCPVAPSDGLGRDGVALQNAIAEQFPVVSAQESRAFATAAVRHSAELCREYRVATVPWANNVFVNLGLRPRGLCWHWARDLQGRIDDGSWDQLVISRAIANLTDPLRLDHSVVVVGVVGTSLEHCLAIDPWEGSGRVKVYRVGDDRRRAWLPASVAQRYRREHSKMVLPEMPTRAYVLQHGGSWQRASTNAALLRR